MKGIKFLEVKELKGKIKHSYNKKLQKLLKAMFKSSRNGILEMAKTQDVDFIKSYLETHRAENIKIFEEQSQNIIKSFVEDVKKDNLKTFQIGFSHEYDERLKADIQNNVALIKNIPEKAYFEISQDVFNSIADNENEKSLFDRLIEREEITARRAKTIARDQTAKMYSTISQYNQQSSGIEYYKWKTADDERVSRGKGGHKQLNNKIYKYEETIDNRKPIIDSYGNSGVPSQRVNCRCVAIPIYIEDGYNMIWNESEKSYEVKKQTINSK